MALVKIGEISVKLEDAIHLFNFMTSVLQWDKEEFKKYSKNNSLWCSNLDCLVTVVPEFILLPQYSFSYLSSCTRRLIEKGFLDIKPADEIRPEYFTSYNIFRFKPSSESCDPIGGLEFQYQFETTIEDKNKIGMSYMRTMIIGYECDSDRDIEDKRICRSDFYLPIHSHNNQLTDIEWYIRTLKSAFGRSYSKYRRSEHYSPMNNISKSAENLEKTFINFLNLTYTLFTGKFKEKWFSIYPLFETVEKTLQELGESFDKVLETIRAFSTLIG